MPQAQQAELTRGRSRLDWSSAAVARPSYALLTALLAAGQHGLRWMVPTPASELAEARGSQHMALDQQFLLEMALDHLYQGGWVDMQIPEPRPRPAEAKAGMLAPRHWRLNKFYR